MSRYAVIENGVVTNTVAWDGVSDWSPPEGAELVELSEDDPVGPRWTYDGSVFRPRVGTRSRSREVAPTASQRRAAQLDSLIELIEEKGLGITKAEIATRTITKLPMVANVYEAAEVDIAQPLAKGGRTVR